ncbi:hypothetical protein NHH03_00385 [Stieleria sp. TO1_6]|uniref:hypothetical protein n=1 Tax=Stieleria tagensis TaxID=2956795 RepID=UPI00209A789F|nr:hypothetical protein [Stieleria tagensis]MCO8120177.1 hypothetical protein [Stieleria tagensis]
MHERTQRAVARLLFVFCCAVPTSLVVMTVLVTWTSWYQSRQLAKLTYQLGRETGLVFQIDSCQQIAPGKYVLKNVRMSDPETGRNIAKIRLIDYLHDEDRVGIWLHQPELQSAGLGRAWSLIHDRLISAPAHTVLPIQIIASNLNIHSRTGSLPLKDVSATVTPESTGVRVIASAGDTSTPGEPLLRASLFRDRSNPLPSTEVVFSTDGTALPCSAIAEYIPAAEMLGPEAHFSGSITARQQADGWVYELGNPTITGIELSRLTQDLPHRVIGDAELHLRRCLIQPGRRVSMIGSLRATEIRLGYPLLASMRDRLGLIIDEQAAIGSSNATPRGIAAIDFEINDASIQLTGVCDAAQPGVAIYAHSRPIAWTDGGRSDTQQITAILDPPSSAVSSWHQIFLPAAAAPAIASRPAGEIRSLRRASGGPAIRQH